MNSVYVIGALDGGARKIGVSYNVPKRLGGLHSERELSIVATYPRDDATMVERMAHYLLREKHIRGEWFNVTDDEAASAIKRAIGFIDAGGNAAGFGQGKGGRQRVFADHAMTRAERQQRVRANHRAHLERLARIEQAARALIEAPDDIQRHWNALALLLGFTVDGERPLPPELRKRQRYRALRDQTKGNVT